MKKIKIIAIFSLICLFLLMPAAFAMDNQTDLGATDENILAGNEHYFDANVNDDTGDGSEYNPYKNLYSNRIEDNSILYFGDGEYVLDKQVIANNVTFIGENAQNTIINCNNKAIYTSSSFTLHNVTLINGAIFDSSNTNIVATNVIFKDSLTPIHATRQNTNVYLDGCTFSNNQAMYEVCGGAININQATAYINNCLFIGNYAELSGGAIGAENGAKVSIKKSRFIDDHSTQNFGGAIYVHKSEVNCSDVEIVNCTSNMGGAVISLNGNLNVHNLTARDNSAKYCGGAIYSVYGRLYLYDSSFSNNSAKDGGALFLDEVYDFVPFNNNFSNNRALNIAGAVYSAISDANYPNSVLDDTFHNSFFNNSASFKDDVYECEGILISSNSSDYILIGPVEVFDDEIPVSYDLREFNLVTPVKNQGSNGNCWAFTSIAALESAILKATGITYDLSEDNMKNIMSKYSGYGWAMEPNKGGYDRMGYGYLVSWLGPVNETDDEYSLNGFLSPVMTSFIHVQNIMFLQRSDYTDNDNIKRAIMNYGAVGTSIHWYQGEDGANNYISGKNVYWDRTDKGVNHAVTIVGWDDSYSRYNFKITPEGDGAWIIKNSWGTNKGENGFYYVSYYDTSLAPLNKPESTFVFVFNDTIKFDKNYQYDISGRTSFLSDNMDAIWYKNKFNATDKEYLAGVSTYFKKDTSWDLSIYVNGALKYAQSGFSTPSYSTIELNELIPLEAGDIFEVEFKISSDGDVAVPISQRSQLNKEIYHRNTSFISYDGIEWMDIYELNGRYPSGAYDSQVACIKAFTILNKVETSIELAMTNIREDKADVVAVVYNQWGRVVKSGNVTFIIDNERYTVAITNGAAKLVNVAISDGEINNIGAEFEGRGYSSQNNFILYTASKLDTSLELSFSSSNNPIDIIATLRDVNDEAVLAGEVIFNINGVNHTVRVVDGEARLTGIFDVGCMNNVTAFFNELYCYNPSSSNTSFVVGLHDVGMEVLVSGEQNPVTITALIRDGEGNNVDYGYVTFEFGGVGVIIPVKDGVASIDHIFDSIGINNVSVGYFGGYYYNSSRKDISLNISLLNTILKLNVSQNSNNPVDIVAVVSDEYGSMINMGEVEFIIERMHYPVKVVNGVAKITHAFTNDGAYAISASYNTNHRYLTSSDTSQVNVSKIDVGLSLDIKKNINNANIVVEFSRPIDGYAYVSVDNKNYIKKIQNSKAVFNLKGFDVGNHSVRAWLAHNYLYEANEAEGNFTVYTYNTALQANYSEYCGKSDCLVTLKNTDGDLLAGRLITVTVGDRTYSGKTNGSGVAVIAIDLDYDSHNIDLSFAGDNDYLGCGLTCPLDVKTTVISSDAKKAVNALYSFSLLDGTGTPLKNTAVDITFANKAYKISTDENGVASLALNFNPGAYLITITNPATGEVKSQTVNVVKRIAENTNIAIYYGAGLSYKVRIYDDDVNVARNAKVVFRLNGRAYSVNTNAYGYAYLKINLKPNTYTVTAEYNGCKVSNRIVVKTTLITRNVAVKKGKILSFTPKVLSTKGQLLKNKLVIIKFKGKTYRVKTNSRGIATLKIKANYNAGRYVIVTTYSGLSNKNVITVKR